MDSSYSALYLAPHLDDAALSCGGQIYDRARRGERVLIVTVMAGDPAEPELSDYVRSLHDRWQLAADAASQRRREDEEACRILGADFLHLDVPDCIYRTDPATGAALYLSDDELFGDVARAESVLVAAIAAEFRRLPSAAEVVAPLTVGHHVDHLLVRQAAEATFGADIGYYEDYPYAQEEGAVEVVLAGPNAAAWQPQGIAVSPAGMEAKIEAILAFRSQLSTFFTDRADLERQVRGYAEAVGGERIWHKNTNA